MSSISRSVVALVLGLTLCLGAGTAWAADGPQETSPGVGPNGEVNGLTAKFIDVNGVRTRYFEYGEGEPLVLLHGGGLGSFSRPRNNANVWALNIPGLAKHFHVFALDRIGAGLTDIPKDDNQLTREGDANHVYEFIKAVGLTEVHLVGHSAGGGVAQVVALRHPEVVRTLVIANTGGETPLARIGIDSISYIREWACTSLKETDEMLAWRCWCNVMSGNPAVWDDAFFEASWEMYNRPRQREIQAYMAGGAGAAARQREGGRSWRTRMEEAGKGPAWQMPILYVTSATDTHDHMPVDEISGMQRTLGHYNFLGSINDRVLLVVYSKGGHFPYRQYPERFNYDVTQFIDYWKTAGQGN